MNNDSNLIFSDNVAIIANANSDILDLGAIGVKVPVHACTVPLCLTVQVTETFNTLTSLTVALQTSDTNNAGTLNNPIILISQTLPLAGLTAGSRFSFSYMPNDVDEYAQLVYTIAGSAPTKGKIFAALTLSQMNN